MVVCMVVANIALWRYVTCGLRVLEALSKPKCSDTTEAQIMEYVAHFMKGSDNKNLPRPLLRPPIEVHSAAVKIHEILWWVRCIQGRTPAWKDESRRVCKASQLPVMPPPARGC